MAGLLYSKVLPEAQDKTHQPLDPRATALLHYWQQTYGDKYYKENRRGGYELMLSLPLAQVLHQGLGATYQVLAHPIVSDWLVQIFSTWQATDDEKVWRDRLC